MTTQLDGSFHSTLSTDHEEFEIVSITSEPASDARRHSFGQALHYHSSTLPLPQLGNEPVPTSEAVDHFGSSFFTPADDIQAYVNGFVATDEDATTDDYRINSPPRMRPVRVYIASLCDVLHPGLLLNLRQAKYSFPLVHLLVGVYANPYPSSLARTEPVFTHLERCEAIRHVRYVDEVIPNTPWAITTDFLKEWNIDYVVFDEERKEFGLDLAKTLGKYLPIRSTKVISANEVYTRIKCGTSTVIGHAHTREKTITPLTATTEDAEENTPEPHALLDPFAC